MARLKSRAGRRTGMRLVYTMWEPTSGRRTGIRLVYIMRGDEFKMEICSEST
jgi:hypothetical protein